MATATAALSAGMRPLPEQVRKTLPWDRGGELAGSRAADGLEALLR
ncbi:hypothetical protein [Streptomyces sp. NPDC090445]